ncbi:protease pro-enzyme activation domain-containing protein [Sulfobacillus thermotolerans]|uniref:protease pro-enzyme activation domain-containing protein n=1 Tax=Sulfobacillus thermotolerans TaxID=338644 RepID=UPI003369BD3F
MSKANSSKYIWQHAVKRGALAVNIRAIPFILSTAMILPLINVKVMAATPLAYAVPIKSLPHTGLPSTPFYQSELPTLEHSASQGTVRNVTILVDTPRRAALLQNYARAVSTPTSPLYHHFLTPQKLAQEFGPSPKAFAQVMQAVSDAGWQIIHRTALTLSAEIPAHRSTLKIPVARDLYAIDGLSPVHIITPHATLAKAWTHSPGHLVTVRSETSTSNLTSYDFSQPPTQVESVTASNGDSITVANASGLGIPDIASMAGFPSFQGVIDGSVVGLGGTSLAAPLTAGWLDDLETADGIQHIGLGNINPLLFNAAQDHPQDFMQALWGSNGYYSVTSSAPGSWNPVTGLGAPNWDQLAQVWDPQSTSASQLQWTHVPSQAVAGIQQMWTLKVLNGQGNLVSTFANTVTLTSSDTHAHFPAQITFTNGQAQVPVTFESPGTQSLTAFGPHGANIQPATVSLSVVPAPTISTSSNPVVAQPITVTVGFSSSSAALSYQFWIRNPQTGLWSAPQGGFSSRNTLHFTPVVPGRYDLIVYIQGLGSSPVTFSDTINVLAPKNTPMVSALHLSGPSAFASRGQSLTLTAQATDANGTPLYQFWLLAPNKGWEMVQNYSPQNTWTISNLQPGSYVIAVYALDGQQFAQHDFSQAFDATTVINVDSHVNLTISSTNPVALDAHASGISNPVYQFWIQSPNGQWHASGAYGAGTDLFQPNGSGTYTIVVYAKDLYAPATSAFAVSTSMTFTVPAN